MTTISLISFITALYLSIELPNKVYPFYWKDFFNFEKDSLKLRDRFALMFGCSLASLVVTVTFFLDYYNFDLEKLRQKNSTDAVFLNKTFIPFLYSGVSYLWLLFIIIYYYFVMRKNQVKFNDVNKHQTEARIVTKIETGNKKISNNIFIGLIVFVISSIGEGFFQDLIYTPILKPLLCKFLNVCCS